MIGLRVKETEKFLRFFELVQKEAEFLLKIQKSSTNLMITIAQWNMK